MSQHLVPVRTYVLICTVLLGLTWLTVQAAFIDLGALSLVVALGIAFTKATLVFLYFMHVRWSSRLVGVIIVAGIMWIGILIILLLSDYMSRDWMSMAGV